MNTAGEGLAVAAQGGNAMRILIFSVLTLIILVAGASAADTSTPRFYCINGADGHCLGQSVNPIPPGWSPPPSPPEWLTSSLAVQCLGLMGDKPALVEKIFTDVAPALEKDKLDPAQLRYWTTIVGAFLELEVDALTFKDCRDWLSLLNERSAPAAPRTASTGLPEQEATVCKAWNASERIRSAWTAQSVHLDGAYDRAEWRPAEAACAGALLQVGRMLVQNDAANLYILLDLIRDTGDDPPGYPPKGDFVALFVDFDHDGRPTPQVDVAYLPDPDTNQLAQVTVGVPNVLKPTLGRLAVGFGASPAGATPHRVWEIALPLDEIEARPGEKVQFGLHVHSKTPPFDLDQPPHPSGDVVNLFEVALSAGATGADQTARGGGTENNASDLIGCYADKATRDLNGAGLPHTNDMTTEKCVAYCASQNFTYAGTQDGAQCFCGESYGKFGVSSACNESCVGNIHEICGGDWANSVYRVPSDLKKAEEQKRLARQEEVRQQAKRFAALLAAFVEKARINTIADPQLLNSNPFAYEGQTIGVRAAFYTMIDRDAAVFRILPGQIEMIVSGLSTTLFTQSNEILLVAQIIGKGYATYPRVTHLRYMDSFACREAGCEDIKRQYPGQLR